MRNVPKRARKWLRPVAIEREYVRYVRLAADEYQAAVDRYVLPCIDLLPENPMRSDAIEDIPESAGWFETLRQGFLSAARSLASAPITQRVAEFARRTSTFNKQQMTGVLRSAYGVDVTVSEPWLPDSLRVWESENIGRIKSIPKDSLERLHGKIVNQVRAGKTKNDLRKTIQEDYGVSKKKADLIANDQIGKLNGQLTEERQVRMGVKKYKWRGALDERERDEHVRREGVIFSWDEPPEDGHPGEPIRCRCNAEAILPLLEDLEGLQYTDLTPARGKSLTILGNNP